MSASGRAVSAAVTGDASVGGATRKRAPLLESNGARVLVRLAEMPALSGSLVLAQKRHGHGQNRKVGVGAAHCVALSHQLRMAA